MVVLGCWVVEQLSGQLKCMELQAACVPPLLPNASLLCLSVCAASSMCVSYKQPVPFHRRGGPQCAAGADHILAASLTSVVGCLDAHTTGTGAFAPKGELLLVRHWLDFNQQNVARWHLMLWYSHGSKKIDEHRPTCVTCAIIPTSPTLCRAGARQPREGRGSPLPSKVVPAVGLCQGCSQAAVAVVFCVGGSAVGHRLLWRYVLASRVGAKHDKW